MDEGVRGLLDNIIEGLNKLTEVTDRLSRRLDALEGRATPQPRQGIPNYMSGRWYQRDGTGFGKPP